MQKFVSGINKLAEILQTQSTMKILRLILIFLVGGFLTYLTYKSKYQTFFFEAIIWGGLILVGLMIFLWTIIKDFQQFKTERRLVNFALTFLTLLFTIIILTIEIRNKNDFNKPTLLKVFYDGDYNGTGIDFKTGGTYIFDNSAIGLSDYTYGTYEIKGNKLTLDRNKIDNLTELKYLELKEKEIDYQNVVKKELYLYQVNKNGEIIDRANEYRVTIDNRK